jgi:hypothetical protein
MTDKPNFDLTAAHKFFSADNFNKTWEFIQKAERSPEDNLNMIQSAMASLWHWTQREDAANENLSIGYWQVSRALCLIGQPELARAYGRRSLKFAEHLAPFYKGYACETLARAEMLANNRVIMLEYLNRARELAQQVKDEEDKQLLLNDLDTIK